MSAQKNVEKNIYDIYPVRPRTGKVMAAITGIIDPTINGAGDRRAHFLPHRTLPAGVKKKSAFISINSTQAYCFLSADEPGNLVENKKFAIV